MSEFIGIDKMAAERKKILAPDPIADRRQRALEAFWDESQGTMTGANDGLREAIEVATEVKITDDILGPGRYENLEVIRNAFRAAGFKVVE